MKKHLCLFVVAFFCSSHLLAAGENIVFVGDSIINDNRINGARPAHFRKFRDVFAQYGVNVINLSANGRTLINNPVSANQINTAFWGYSPDVFVLTLGANDWGSLNSSTSAYFNAYLQLMQNVTVPQKFGVSMLHSHLEHTPSHQASHPVTLSTFRQWAAYASWFGGAGWINAKAGFPTHSTGRLHPDGLHLSPANNYRALEQYACYLYNELRARGAIVGVGCYLHGISP